MACTSVECGPGTTRVRDACVPLVVRDAAVEPDAAADPDAGPASDDAGEPERDAGDGGAVALDACVTQTFYADGDGDGFGDEARSVEACSRPAGYALEPGDCDDATATAYPGAPDDCDAVDDDCDTAIDEDAKPHTYYLDGDSDGFGQTTATAIACTAPSGYATAGGDCDDTRIAVFPGAAEICNTRDDDCDAATDEGVQIAYYPDCDGDGYAPASAPARHACSVPGGAPGALCPSGRFVTQAPTTTATTDCHDSDDRAHPGQIQYFDTQARILPGEPSAGLYDFDCDGAETPRYTSGAPSCVAGPPPSTCTPRSGWADGTPPGCGAVEQLETCSTFCTESATATRQPCR